MGQNKFGNRKMGRASEHMCSATWHVFDGVARVHDASANLLGDIWGSVWRLTKQNLEHKHQFFR